MNVQLANTYNPAKKYKAAQWYATPKFDGVRAVFIPDRGFFTRNDKPIGGLDDMSGVLEGICCECGLWFIDGELIVQGKTFQASQGVILASEHEEKSLIEYHVFAVGGGFMNTDSMLNAIPDEQKANIFRVDSELIPNNFQAVEEACRKFTSMGYEGVVLRDPNVSYFGSRSDYLLKYKFFKEADLRITGVQEGTGKLKGTLGSLTVEGEIDGVRVRSCVGTGLSDEDRNILYADTHIIGKVLTVKYQSLTDKPDKNGVYSLRFPSVIGLKEDRDFLQETACIRTAKSVAVEKPSNVIYHKDGTVEVGFQVKFVDRPPRKLSYIPDKATMADWKSKLNQCRSIQEGIKLIADLKLTIPKIRTFAKYLGVKMTGCKYLKAEIVRWLINASLGAWLRADALMKVLQGKKEIQNAGLFNDFSDHSYIIIRNDKFTLERLLEIAGHFP